MAMGPQPITVNDVWLDHDGNLDDLVALLTIINLQVSKKKARLIGVSLVPADCYREGGLTGTLSLLNHFGIKVPVGASDIPGKNPFPDIWRREADAVFKKHWDELNLPLVTEDSPIGRTFEVSSDVPRLMHRTVVESGVVTDGSLTVVLTGPATNFTQTLQRYPTVGSKVKEVFYMAGAFRAKGNVKPHDHAEWNVYWDPAATRDLFKLGHDMSFPVVCVSLDVCNHLPSKGLVETVFESPCFWPERVKSMYRDIHAAIGQAADSYYLWDVNTVVAAFFPDLYSRRLVMADVILEGEEEGQTMEVTEGGFPVHVVEFGDETTATKLFRKVLHIVDFSMP